MFRFLEKTQKYLMVRKILNYFFDFTKQLCLGMFEITAHKSLISDAAFDSKSEPPQGMGAGTYGDTGSRSHYTQYGPITNVGIFPGLGVLYFCPDFQC